MKESKAGLDQTSLSARLLKLTAKLRTEFHALTEVTYVYNDENVSMLRQLDQWVQIYEEAKPLLSEEGSYTVNKGSLRFNGTPRLGTQQSTDDPATISRLRKLILGYLLGLMPGKLENIAGLTLIARSMFDEDSNKLLLYKIKHISRLIEELQGEHNNFFAET